MSDDGPSTVVHSEVVSVPNGRRLSQILTAIACDETRRRISVCDLADTFGNRAYGTLIFIFAAPNALPVVVPGLSAILGAPLLFPTRQLTAGRPHPWLPGVILPIPFGNMLPGLAVLAGLLSAIVSAALVAGVVYGLAKAALFIIQNALGL